MKKFRLLAVRAQKEELMRELMRLGCVQLREQDDLFSDPDQTLSISRETSDAAEWRARKTQLAEAIRLLDRYSPKKTPLLSPKPEMAEGAFLDESGVAPALDTAREITELDEKARADAAEQVRQKLLIEALKPWRSFELPLETNGTKQVGMVLGTVSGSLDMSRLYNALSEALPESQIYEIGADKVLHYLCVFYIRESEDVAMQTLRDFGFAAPAYGSMTGTASANIDACKKTIDGLVKDKADCEAKITALAARRDELKACYDRIDTELGRAEASELLVGTERTVVLEGWAEAPAEKELKALLDRYDCAYELTDPAEDEYPAVPVRLKNNKLTNGLNMVTNMYSLPLYGTVDPNPLMAPFFILFYGIMMSDIGYGVIMMLMGLLIIYKKKPTGGALSFGQLIFEAGITTTIMGFLTGSLFGDAPLHIAQIINPNTTFTGLPSLFDPLNDTVYVLIGAMILGCIQLVTGTVISFVQKVKHGNVADAIWTEAAWWVVMIGIALAVLKIGTVAGVPVVLVIGGVMFLYGATRGAKGFGKVAAMFSAIYSNVTGWFGDILSYSRLMALMLAGSVISQVFNTLGAMPGNMVVFVVIFLIGQTLNFALNLLGCYVHDLRLQCLEFFNKFYSEGGKPFRPLAFRTKYYDIVK